MSSSPALFVVVRRAAFGRPFGLLGFRGRPCALRSAENDDEDDSTNSDPYFTTGTLGLIGFDRYERSTLRPYALRYHGVQRMGFGLRLIRRCTATQTREAISMTKR